MKHQMVRWAMIVALVSAGVVPAMAAEDAPKALPTLLIKGEVVSVDTNDPAESLLKVKDRYGFETPIYLTGETKIAQGDQAMTASQLGVGTAVEVEYNFDINTAKRHGVRVALSQPAAPQISASVTTPAAVPAPASIPAPIAEPAATMTPPASDTTEPAAASTPAAEPAPSEAPATEATE